MRRNIENIEIKEPPIEELKKRSSCLKSTCFTGFGCIIIFIIGSLLLLKFASGPNTKELKKIPNNFPANIPVYDKDSIDKIIFTPGQTPSKIKELAAFVPKLILSPVLMILDKKEGDNGPTFTWQNFQKFMQEQPLDLRDTVEIQWKNLPAEPRFIEKYYQTELEKNNYTIEITSNSENNFQFAFKGDKIEGAFYLMDNLDAKGTDTLSLTVKIGK